MCAEYTRLTSTRLAQTNSVSSVVLATMAEIVDATMGRLDATIKSIHELSGADLKKVYLTAAKQFHPDKNTNNPNATEWFQRLQHAYEENKHRLGEAHAPCKAQENDDYTKSKKAKKPTREYPTYNECCRKYEAFMTREQEKEIFRSVCTRKLEETHPLKKVIASVNNRPPRVQRETIHFRHVKSNTSTKLYVHDANTYTSAALVELLKKQDWPPANPRVRDCYLVLRQDDSQNTFHLLGTSSTFLEGELNQQYIPRQNSTIFLVTVKDMAEYSKSQSCDSLETYLYQAIVDGKKALQKKKPKTCGLCGHNWTSMKDQIQECTKCKKNFHRECMPVWIGLPEEPYDHTAWYEMTAGKREHQHQQLQMWDNTSLPDRYMDAEMPADLSQRFDFCFTCACTQSTILDYDACEKYVRNDLLGQAADWPTVLGLYKCGKRRKTCAQEIDFREDHSTATKELEQVLAPNDDHSLAIETLPHDLQKLQQTVNPIGVREVLSKLAGFKDFMDVASTATTDTCEMTIGNTSGMKYSEKHTEFMTKEHAALYTRFRKNRRPNKIVKALEKFVPKAVTAIASIHPYMPKEKPFILGSRLMQTERPTIPHPVLSLEGAHCDDGRMARGLLVIVVKQTPGTRQRIEWPSSRGPVS